MSVEDALFHYHFPINNPHKEPFINDVGYGNVWVTKGTSSMLSISIGKD